ncbi:DegQ family serine endoprotease [Cobetia marina]|uniref:DegQ family serine endoprotease n=1 Tax=Cobetia marina TaxID=28258 RepID=UPI002548F352|nr:DegQ family serine endoprotease [Cobetia pacifica]MDI6004069.1 DegQ family serine endoprotease [Cobetia pacifica]
MKSLSRLMAPALAMAALMGAQMAQARELPDFTQLVKDSAPAVVNIATTTEIKRTSGPVFRGPDGQEMPEFFKHFFGDQFPGQGRGGIEKRSSLGSGFIISDDGYIMTNAHVVDGADEVMVRLNDRRELKAQVVGEDKKTDIALLKVKADDLPTLPMGDSDALEVGQWVAAIGSPFGFDHSVTAGIVSAIDRTLPSDAYVPFIQTDVAINPGNSGGPLFDLEGDVVGINSQIYTRSGGFMGVSFAIPINVAMDVADKLKTDGRVDRGWLGVVIQPVSKDLAESFGLDRARGALIADLDPDGPAAASGLKAGDIIMAVDGDEVENSANLPRMVGASSPGDSLKLSILRDGKRQTLQAKVGHWPGSDQDEIAAASNDKQGLGIAVTELGKAALADMNLDNGVKVLEVDPQGVAAEAGITAGDVLVELNQQPLTSVQSLRDVVAKLPADRPVSLRLVRNGRPLYIALRMREE